MLRKGVIAVSAGLLILAATIAHAAVTYHVDRVHSSVTFRVRHLVSKVSGNFTDFDGLIVLDREDVTKSSVEFNIKTASIDTDNENRDGHLRTDDFFNAEKYPNITFKSTAISKGGENKYNVTGDFHMRDTTKSITIPVDILGFSGDSSKVGFETTFTINRQDYGVKYNSVLEGGGLVLGDDVEVTINIEAALPKEKK